MPISAEQRDILTAIASGWTLKAHRYVDGRKEYRLHPLSGEATTVAPGAVAALVSAGLIDSNKKFPAATFWLTERGQEIAPRDGSVPQSQQAEQSSKSPQHK
jgi:hypothetical protein